MTIKDKCPFHIGNPFTKGLWPQRTDVNFVFIMKNILICIVVYVICNLKDGHMQHTFITIICLCICYSNKKKILLKVYIICKHCIQKKIKQEQCINSKQIIYKVIPLLMLMQNAKDSKRYNLHSPLAPIIPTYLS